MTRSKVTFGMSAPGAPMATREQLVAQIEADAIKLRVLDRMDGKIYELRLKAEAASAAWEEAQREAERLQASIVVLAGFLAEGRFSK